ncbi:MAG: hypothetical protein A3C58_00300 [Candidatus Staskawiczbacteria bacterium RIFCSPHIGHO2_02_FULL_34_10]|uniref:Uncharacterized protein n=1 Tax=Candidatus Staskawiczbacteria bacterium RIFCSPHIGHO2_02_FULL_34_10 TaxID=1802205 RepID=A0A1G2HVN3_9BACT|nr:MAG: hypothetical protein A3C58_00300 [Candidatus Staskawiczbacteria bacterium RIFCSPHIGHO2_02_FULL_34_10]
MPEKVPNEINFDKDPIRKAPDEQIISESGAIEDMDFERKIVETYRIVRLINMISGYFKGRDLEKRIFNQQGEKFVKAIEGLVEENRNELKQILEKVNSFQYENTRIKKMSNWSFDIFEAPGSFVLYYFENKENREKYK